MKLLIFFGCALTACILYFIPRKNQNNPNIDMLKKYSNEILFQKTLNQYEDFKRLQPTEASQTFIEMLASLANIFKTICYFHIQSKATIVTQCSPDKPIDLCEFERVFKTLVVRWKNASRYGNDEFNTLLMEFPRNFHQDAYLKLAVLIVDYGIDTENKAYEVAESTSPLVELTILTLVKLESNVALVSRFINDQIKKTENDIEMWQQSDDMYFYDMGHSLNLMENTKIEARETTLKMITLLCAQEFWGKTIRVGKDTLLIICLFTWFLIILFYNFDVIPFTLAFACHIVFAMVYVRMYGCLCKIRKYLWTLDLIDKYKEEQRKLQPRHRKNRRRKRRT